MFKTNEKQKINNKKRKGARIRMNSIVCRSSSVLFLSNSNIYLHVILIVVSFRCFVDAYMRGFSFCVLLHCQYTPVSVDYYIFHNQMHKVKKMKNRTYKNDFSHIKVIENSKYEPSSIFLMALQSLKTLRLCRLLIIMPLFILCKPLMVH